jgi:hypothetical protein
MVVMDILANLSSHKRPFMGVEEWLNLSGHFPSLFPVLIGLLLCVQSAMWETNNVGLQETKLLLFSTTN